MCAYNVAARGVVSIKQLNWNITDGRFRSYVLWVISHNHLQNGLYVKKVEDDVLQRASSAPHRYVFCALSAMMHWCEMMIIPATRFDRVTSWL